MMVGFEIRERPIEREAMSQIMTIEFADAINGVIHELSEELDWHYEANHLMVSAPALDKIRRAVAILEEAKYEPAPAAVAILAKYKRQQN
jgi:hypothetical protein